MPSVSPAQHKFMEAVAHTKGGYGGVPQAVGREFVAADDADDFWGYVEFRVADLLERIEAIEDGRKGDDAGWNEADHPRANDGKFTSGAGGGGAKGADQAAQAYVQSQKGKKVTSAGLIKHLLKNGHYENDIFEAAKKHTGLGADKKNYVAWYHNDLKKSGFPVPPLMKGASLGQVHQAEIAAIKQAVAQGASIGEKPKMVEKELAAVKPAEQGAEHQQKQNFADKLANLHGTSLAKSVFDVAKAPTNYSKAIGGKLKAVLEAHQEAKDAQELGEKLEGIVPFSNAQTDQGLIKFNAYLHQLKLDTEDKIDKEINSGIEPEGAAETPSAGKVEKPALASAKAPQPAPPAKVAPGHKVSAAAKELREKIKSNLPNMLSSNREAVEKKLSEIEKALNHDTHEAQVEALKKIEPFPPGQGMGKTSTNQLLQLIHQDYGTAYDPSAKAKKIEALINTLPPQQFDHKFKLENAEGKRLKAHFYSDTDHILPGFYAKVTAAYEGNPDNAVSYAVDQAMESYATETRKKLTQDQIYALDAYQDGVYGKINKALNGNESYLKVPEVKQAIKGIREAFQKDFNVVPADTPAFRGIDATIGEITGFNDEAKAVGRCFVHKNFASISRRHQTSASFAHSHTILKFTIPAGTKGITMHHQDGEREIVLNEKSMWRVDKITHNEYGCKNVLHVTFIGHQVEEE